VPPEPVRRLRDLTQYRIDLVTEGAREKNRVEKLPGEAGIKVSVVVSDIFGVSRLAIVGRLIAG
jgi:transposase